MVPPGGPPPVPPEAAESERMGGTSTCWMPLRASSWALIFAAAAARFPCQYSIHKHTHAPTHPKHHLFPSKARNPSHALPAAAAGSARSAPSFAGAAGDPGPASLRSLDSGLLSRVPEPSLLLRAGGDLERRSKREALRGSASFWSKRERFTVRRSESSIVCVFVCCVSGVLYAVSRVSACCCVK